MHRSLATSLEQCFPCTSLYPSIFRFGRFSSLVPPFSTRSVTCMVMSLTHFYTPRYSPTELSFRFSASCTSNVTNQVCAWLVDLPMSSHLVVHVALSAAEGCSIRAAVFSVFTPSWSHAMRRGLLGVSKACVICWATVGALRGCISTPVSPLILITMTNATLPQPLVILTTTTFRWMTAPTRTNRFDANASHIRLNVYIRKMGRCWHDQSYITNTYQQDLIK